MLTLCPFRCLVQGNDRGQPVGSESGSHRRGGFLRAFGLPVENVVDGFLRSCSRDNHQLRIALKRTNPAGEISGIVAERDLLDAGMAGQKRGIHLGDQYLARVVAIAEALRLIERRPVEPPCGTRAVRQFVESAL